MPKITVQMFSGRTTDQKKRLAKSITDAVVEICGSEPDDVETVFTDVDREDWAVGGVLCTEIPKWMKTA